MFTFNEDVSGVTFVICGVTSCQWCYLMKLCKLFHKEDKWLNWNKLYYSWIKLTLIAIYKSSFIKEALATILTQKIICFRNWWIALIWWNKGKYFTLNSLPYHFSPFENENYNRFIISLQTNNLTSLSPYATDLTSDR